MKMLVLILLSVFGFMASSAQNEAGSKYPDCRLKTYALSYIADGLLIPTAPTRWNSGQWLTAGSVTATASVAYFFDDDIRTLFQNNKSKNLDLIANIAEPFGNVHAGIAGMALLSAYGALSGRDDICRLGMAGIKAFVLTTATTQISKGIFGRQRPGDGKYPDSRKWHGPAISKNNKSFFSNHTSNAFALATVVAAFYDFKPAISAGVYSLAGLTALSRVYDDKHWGSDIIIGAAVGYGIGLLCMNSSHWKVKIRPEYNTLTSSTEVKFSFYLN